MNDIATASRELATTRAAEGLPRLKWSLGQFDQLVEHGILTEQDRVELIGGELVPMAPKGIRHDNVRLVLEYELNRRRPDGLMLLSEPGWRPGGDSYLEPDFVVCRFTQNPTQVPAPEVLLVIEIAITSLKADRGAKARVYAAVGVREYWAVDAVTLSTRVFSEASEQGYGAWRDVPPEETLTPQFVPSLAVSLGGLGIG